MCSTFTNVLKFLQDRITFLILKKKNNFSYLISARSNEVLNLSVAIQRLCDNDPGVMGATLCPLYDLILEESNSYKDLVVSFVNILKQVAERRLPTSYDYHQMPAPFIQVRELN